MVAIRLNLYLWISGVYMHEHPHMCMFDPMVLFSLLLVHALLAFMYMNSRFDAGWLAGPCTAHFSLCYVTPSPV